MEACDKDNYITEDSVEQPVGEPMNEGSPRLADDHRVRLRPLQNQPFGRMNLGEKLFAEAFPLLLVPGVRAIDVSAAAGR